MFHKLTLTELSHLLDQKKVSSVELYRYFLERLSLDKDLNSVVSVLESLGLEQAKKADNMRANDEHTSPLCGIPLAIKDNLCTKDHITTSCSKMLEHYTPPYHATVIEKMLDAGCVPLAKTNMDEFAMGSTTETSYFGACRNPWHTNHVPGGSSGGSASIVAARLLPASLGTDTGGSIRQPAAFCGLTGLKPTYGNVSRYGLMAFASSLDQIGPLGLTAEDVGLFMNVIAGHDPKDMTSIRQPQQDFNKELNQNIKGLKIGIADSFFTDALSPEVGDKIYSVIDQLCAMGAKKVKVSIDTAKYAVPTYYIIAPSECSSNLSRYDGAKYGYRCENPENLQDLYKRSRSEGFGAEVKRRIILGTFALSSGYYDAYYQKAKAAAERITADLNSSFDDVDVIISPTAPSVAYPMNYTKNPLEMYLSDIYTIPANLSGLPAISAPAGFSDGLPVGFQLMGPRLSDAKLIGIVHQFQKVSDWHTQIPKDYI